MTRFHAFVLCGTPFLLTSCVGQPSGYAVPPGQVSYAPTAPGTCGPNGTYKPTFFEAFAGSPSLSSNSSNCQRAFDAQEENLRRQELANQAAIAAQKQREAAAEDARKKAEQDIIDAKAAAAKAKAQLAAENSPNNTCKIPGVAGILIDSFSQTPGMRRYDLRAVDAEHITTLSAPDDHNFKCHATMVISNGMRFPATMSVRQNAAGDDITTWSVD